MSRRRTSAPEVESTAPRWHITPLGVKVAIDEVRDELLPQIAALRLDVENLHHRIHVLESRNGDGATDVWALSNWPTSILARLPLGNHLSQEKGDGVGEPLESDAEVAAPVGVGLEAEAKVVGVLTELLQVAFEVLQARSAGVGHVVSKASVGGTSEGTRPAGSSDPVGPFGGTR